jgi:hypothetical protein
MGRDQRILCEISTVRELYQKLDITGRLPPTFKLQDSSFKASNVKPLLETPPQAPPGLLVGSRCGWTSPRRLSDDSMSARFNVPKSNQTQLERLGNTAVAAPTRHVRFGVADASCPPSSWSSSLLAPTLFRSESLDFIFFCPTRLRSHRLGVSHDQHVKAQTLLSLGLFLHSGSPHIMLTPAF